MSRPFYHICSKFNMLNNKIFILDNKIRAQIIGTLVCGHALYSYGTQKHNTITVANMYTYTQNARSEFMIIDDTGKHYNINNSLWYWKWDSIEDWYNLNKGDKIFIKYYGYRIPFLGLFPNIFYSKNISCDNSSDTNIKHFTPLQYKILNS